MHAALTEAYRGRPLVEVASLDEAAALRGAGRRALADTNRLKLFVFGNEKIGQARIAAVFDNLGRRARHGRAE